MSTHHNCLSPPSAGPVSVWAVRYCSYIQVYVSKPGTCTDQPCIYTAAPFRLQKHGEHSLLWGLGCPTEGCRKKDEWREGWMGGALAWLQSQLWIGCCPGNGTSDLIYPLAHPSPYPHPALAHAHLFYLTLSPSLFSAWELKLFFLCPFFHRATLTRVATFTQSRWESQVGQHFLLLLCWLA